MAWKLHPYIDDDDDDFIFSVTIIIVQAYANISVSFSVTGDTVLIVTSLIAAPWLDRIVESGTSSVILLNENGKVAVRGVCVGGGGRLVS